MAPYSEEPMSDSNPACKDLAEKHTIIRAVVGSTAHGLNLEGTDDRDEMGVCIEPLEVFGGFHEFEQYIYRTATERTGKHDEPSQHGDLDLTIYSLRKFLRLALQGNPSILILLFVDPLSCVYCNVLGVKLQELAPHIISKQAGKRFLGYMESQRQRLLGERGQKKVNRPELEEKYGYDTKYAMHILRLGLQGVELMSTGRITLPMPERDRGFVRAVRLGQISMQDMLTRAGGLEREVKDLLDSGPLPDHPNENLVEEWMIRTYFEMWKAQRFMPFLPEHVM